MNPVTEDCVRERLIQAVTQLAAVEAPHSVTMRQIADHAGVSPGLAYHYFDSRRALFGAALDDMASRITQQIGDSGDPAVTVVGIWEALEQNRAFPRLLASLTLEGEDVATVMSEHPLLKATAERAAADGHEDPATLAGCVGLLGLAGAFWGPAINGILGRAPDEPALLDAVAVLLSDQAPDTA